MQIAWCALFGFQVFCLFLIKSCRASPLASSDHIKMNLAGLATRPFLVMIKLNLVKIYATVPWNQCQMGFDKFVHVWPCFWGCNALHGPSHCDRIQIFYLSNPEEPSALGWNEISATRYLAKAFQPLLPLPLAKESFIVIVQPWREVEWIHCALCTMWEWREEVKRDWMEKLWATLHDYKIASMLMLHQWFAYVIYYKA